MSCSQTEKEEIAQDILYLEHLITLEKQNISKRIADNIDQSQPLNMQMETFSDEVSIILAQISARIGIVEQALVNRHTAELRPEVSTSRSNTKSRELKHKIKAGNRQLKSNDIIAAKDIVSYENLNDLEVFEGTAFRWSGPSNITEIILPIDRVLDRKLSIYLAAIIKPEYLKQLKICIDNIEVKYNVGFSGGLLILNIHLPAIASDFESTTIKVTVPNTHSPMELGMGEDTRKLGIAISRILISKSDSMLVRFFNKIKG